MDSSSNNSSGSDSSIHSTLSKNVAEQWFPNISSSSSSSSLSSLGGPTIRKILRSFRESKLRRGSLIAALGSLINRYSSLFGDEVWTAYEQAFLAALDINDVNQAKILYLNLERRFPSSQRVKRLEGLLLEAQEKWDEADKFYEGRLEEDPTDVMAYKRRVCIQKSKGNTTRAIELLNEYLENFMADDVAWQELADLYISVQMYKQASFCLEEVIIAHPQNYLWYSLHAETLYSVGGQENLILARKYFAYSLELKKDNVRALFGICLCYQTLSQIKNYKLSNTEQEVFFWATKELLAIYSVNQPAMVKLLEGLVKKVKQTMHLE